MGKKLINGAIILSFILSCTSKSQSLFNNGNKKHSVFLDEDKFDIQDKKVIDNFHSYYVAKDKSSKKYSVFYLDNSRIDSNLNYFILSRLSIPKLDSNQYIETGSFEDKEGESKVVIAVEKYNQDEFPDPSIEIYDLWILNRKREKFTKKNENKYLRIHWSYYLKSDTTSYSSYDDFEELIKEH